MNRQLTKKVDMTKVWSHTNQKNANQNNEIPVSPDLQILKSAHGNNHFDGIVRR